MIDTDMMLLWNMPKYAVGLFIAIRATGETNFYNELEKKFLINYLVK